MHLRLSFLSQGLKLSNSLLGCRVSGSQFFTSSSNRHRQSISDIEFNQISAFFSFDSWIAPVSLLERQSGFDIVTQITDTKNGHFHIYSLWAIHGKYIFTVIARIIDGRDVLGSDGVLPVPRRQVFAAVVVPGDGRERGHAGHPLKARLKQAPRGRRRRGGGGRRETDAGVLVLPVQPVRRRAPRRVRHVNGVAPMQATTWLKNRKPNGKQFNYKKKGFD